jgi:multiple sugar transport system permease protein
MLRADIGLFSYISNYLNIEEVRFLERSNLALLSLIFVAFWRTLGFSMILLLAGLKGIPREIYEAAHIDGATWSQQLFRITLPMLRTSFLITIVILNLSYLNEITLPLTFTGGGPGTSTTVISLELYRLAFTNHDYGGASALAFMVFILSLVFIAGYVKLLSLRNE